MTELLSEKPDNLGKIGLRLLIQCRWVAISGQLVAVLAVYYGLGHVLPLWPALWLIIASLLLNLVSISQQSAIQRLDERTLLAFLVFDVAQLSGLLYLTGGLTNPFVVLILAPVVVGTTLLSLRWMAALIGLAVGCLCWLALFHQPLPWPSPGFVVPQLYLAGLWTALVFSVMFIGFYVGLIQRENRRMTQALAIIQMALAREQRMSALGALAAAAAHELGSPLSTLRLVATEMARDLPADHPMAEDIALLVSETGRCRDILAEISRHPEQDQALHPFEMMRFERVIERAIAPHLPPSIQFFFDDDGDLYPLPRLRYVPELQHGLGNLLQNACQFARHKIVVRLRTDANQIMVTITDDGPGFAPGILHRLGEPYLSVRPSGGSNLGLGVFIAQTLLEKTGAQLSFIQAEGGGATQIIVWPRQMLVLLSAEQEKP